MRGGIPRPGPAHGPGPARGRPIAGATGPGHGSAPLTQGGWRRRGVQGGICSVQAHRVEGDWRQQSQRGQVCATLGLQQMQGQINATEAMGNR